MTQIRRRWMAIFVAAMFMLVAAPAVAEEGDGDPELPSVDEVNEHLDDLYRSESSKAEMTMTIVTERRGTRVLEMEAWTKGEDDALFVIRSPAREAGTATLRTEEGLWNYAPRADRLVRVPTGMLSDDWMGSHLTNDDLVQETGYRDDYDVELEWGEEEGERVLVANMTPKPQAPVVYTRVVYSLDAEHWTPRSAEFYDGDRLVRTMTFSDVREVEGRQVPHRMEVQPEDKPGESTTLEYSALEFDLDVDDAIFTRRGLRRIAR